MFTADTMTFGQSIVISALGFATVFAILIILSLVLTLSSKLFVTALGTGKPAPAPAAPAAPTLDEQTYAAVVAAVSEETGLPLDKFKVTSVKEL